MGVTQEGSSKSTSLLANCSTLPSLVVFDLDDTFWEGDVEATEGPPFKQGGPAHLLDKSSGRLSLFKDVPSILEALFESKVGIAVASRTSRPRWAEVALKELNFGGSSVHARCACLAWGFSSKTNHFAHIRQKTGVEFRDMVFFDNEHWNIVDVSRLGVFSAYCPRGLSADLFRAEMERYSRERSADAS
mmetsp:Transcript_18046/g.31111  ORF Transcript_18046/g.31111 Transcript_18046/m.31111 type:complete len:189 (-) Transcript_18046:380-946(-)